MIEDAQKSIRAILYERVTSPLLGSFTIAWVLVNWKVFLVLFDGQLPSSEKIPQIEKYLDIKAGLVCPILATAALVIVYPFVSIWASYLWERSKSKMRENKNSFDLKTVLTIEQSVALKLELARMQEQYRELFKDKKEIEAVFQQKLDQEIEKRSGVESLYREASRQLEEIKSRISEKESSTSKKGKVDLSDDGKVIVSEIVRLGGDNISIDDIRATVKGNRVTIKHELDKITETQILQLMSNGKYSLTKFGREYVISHGFVRSQ